MLCPVSLNASRTKSILFNVAHLVVGQELFLMKTNGVHRQSARVNGTCTDLLMSSGCCYSEECSF